MGRWGGGEEGVEKGGGGRGEATVRWNTQSRGNVAYGRQSLRSDLLSRAPPLTSVATPGPELAWLVLAHVAEWRGPEFCETRIPA